VAATDPDAAVGSQPPEPPFGDGYGTPGGYHPGSPANGVPHPVGPDEPTGVMPGYGYGAEAYGSDGYGTEGYGSETGYGTETPYGSETHHGSEARFGTDPATGLNGGLNGGLDTDADVPPVPSRGGGRRAARKAKRRRIPGWLEILGYVVISLTLTSLIKTFFVQMYYIPSPSMEPTTYKGDRVFVDKLSTWVGGAPARGQVIVFHDPDNWLESSTASAGAINLPDLLADVGILPDQHDDLLIKRIIGVGGDTIECKAQNGPVYRNGVALDESSYIMNGKSGMPCYNGTYRVTVPQGYLWVLGDNREHSGDSSWNFIKKGGNAGFVPTKNVVGHVVGVVSWLRDDHPAGS